ncbi:unnamed protein product [Symbiodinium sp. CCMP2592]|nr:unnamed protein product [Symbiodinium sp. CCMP2592]
MGLVMPDRQLAQVALQAAFEASEKQKVKFNDVLPIGPTYDVCLFMYLIGLPQYIDVLMDHGWDTMHRLLKIQEFHKALQAFQPEHAEQLMACLKDPGKVAAARRGVEGFTPVFLNVYHCSWDKGIRRLNKALTPCVGGIYHAGVEVNNLEWDFGSGDDRTTPAVRCINPLQHPCHRFSRTVHLGFTRLSPEDVADIVSQMLEEYPGPDYDVLSRNCCHFADDFCRRLGVDGVPGWVSLNLSAVGRVLLTVLDNLCSVWYRTAASWCSWSRPTQSGTSNMAACTPSKSEQACRLGNALATN